MKKLSVCARSSIGHVWLVDPNARTLEVFALDGATYRLVVTAGGEDAVVASPFDAAPIELARLWGW